ncbi:uncharacterized protein [Haliotis asinina]|uniref:uncharacterized protein n=1 Tax=Haliotis asinina TaxID=109174 RepID=UPI00353261BE
MDEQGNKDSTTKQTGSVGSPIVPDLCDIVEKWATKNFKKTKPEAKIDYVEINWRKLKFASSVAEFDKEMYGEDPDSKVLLTTSFENNTKKNQHQEFEASEASTSTAITTFKKGFTREKTGDIILNVPEKIRTTAPYFSEEIMINEDGRKTERSRMWKGKTSFDAIAKKNTIVQMLILQKEYHCYYKMTVTIRGTVIVNIKSDISQVRVQNSIATIFEDRKDLFPSYVTCKGKRIFWPIEAHTAFRFGVEVKIRYWYEDIPEKDKRNPPPPTPPNTVEHREDVVDEDQTEVEEDVVASGHVSADSPDNTSENDGDTLDYDENLFGYE